MKHALILLALGCSTPALAQQRTPNALFSDITSTPESIASIERRAAAGDARGMVQLGLAKLSGNRIAKDPEGAVRLLRAAAEKGSPLGAVVLGMALDSGFNGVPRDPVEGVRWLRFAYDHAEQPELKGIAAQLLGFAYGRAGGIGKDLAESRHWYQLGAEAGDTESMGWYGIMLVGALGGPKDSAAAVPWLQRAADAGNPRGMAMLAMLYNAGEGVPKDTAKGLDLLHRAAEGKEPHAAMMLAARYFIGSGVPEDKVRSFRYATIGAEGGDKDAETMLSAMYRTGEGTAIDLDAAERWGLKAAEDGSTRGMIELSLLYATRHDEPKTVYWTRRAAEAGDPSALFIMGKATEIGAGVPKDLAAAIAMYRAAAAKGNQPAKAALVRLGVTP